MRAKKLTAEAGSIRFPADLLAQVDDIAARYGYTRSGLIRQAVREFLAGKA